MESLQMTAYDFVILGIVMLLIVRGIWLGLLKQIIPLLALYLGYFAASRYSDQLLPFLVNVSDNPKVVFLAAYVILFAVTYVVATLLGKGLARVIQVTITPWFDRLLGAMLGCAKALIVVVLLHITLGTLLAPENDMLRSCRTCPTVDNLSTLSLEIIKDEEVRDALRQNKPAIAIEKVQGILQQSGATDLFRPSGEGSSSRSE